MASNTESTETNQPSSCKGCSVTLTDFILLTNDAEKLNDFLCDHMVLSKTKNCPTCGRNMTLNLGIEQFRCNKRTIKYKNKKKLRVRCGKCVSQNSGTFFENARISRKNICRMVAFWIMLPVPRLHIISREVRLNNASCVKWFKYLRQICEYFIFQKRQKLGGVGKIVEIDEIKINRFNGSSSKFGEISIFGAIEQGSKNCFLIPVTKHDRETQMQVIKNNIQPGTTIISDSGKKFSCFESEDFFHLTVDHRYNFVNPNTGAHLQTIIRLWRDVQSKLPRHGSRREYLRDHLAEFMFRHQHSDNTSRIHHIFTAIANSNNRSYVYDNSPQTSETSILTNLDGHSFNPVESTVVDNCHLNSSNNIESMIDTGTSVSDSVTINESSSIFETSTWNSIINSPFYSSLETSILNDDNFFSSNSLEVPDSDPHNNHPLITSPIFCIDEQPIPSPSNSSVCFDANTSQCCTETLLDHCAATTTLDHNYTKL